MATPLDLKQIVSYEELLMYQVIQQEALPRLLVAKGIFTKGKNKRGQAATFNKSSFSILLRAFLKS